MTELSDQNASRFGYLRQQYGKHVEDAEKRLYEEAGIDKSFPKFGRIRRAFARKSFEDDAKTVVDDLTGLLNKKGFKQRLQEEAQRCIRTGNPAVVLVFDANKFKEINDQLGHAKGDEILQLIANTMRSHARATDVMARTGGDEFCAILPDTDNDQAKQYLEMLTGSFNRAFGSIEEYKERGVSMSIGASLLDPADTAKSLDNADKAMYRAKENKSSVSQFHIAV